MIELDRLRGLIVSVQAAAGSPLDDPHVIAAMAAAAEEAGASAVRIQGIANLRAVRERVRIPIVGIIKREYSGFEPYITPTLREVEAIVRCGVEVVAFDATARERPEGVALAELVHAIHGGGSAAMADCAEAADSGPALSAKADILATTLCGYTQPTRGARLPALDLIAAFRQTGAFVICEGGVQSPADAAAARERGADAIVVGTAITNLQWVTARFAQAAGGKRA